MKRREFIRTIAGISIAATMPGCAMAGGGKKKKPNIVMFLVDDMGWQDTSVPFHDEITSFNKLYRTPNMEKLAAEGVKFTNAYSCCVCSPTRISLMTGLNAARHRVTNWTLNKNKAVDKKHKTLEFPKWNVNGLSLTAGIERTVHVNTLPMLLKKEGYKTIHVGKAHFGANDTPGEDPLKVGFDINIAGHAAGGLGSYYGTKFFGNKKDKYVKPWGVPGLEKYYGKDINITEALTLEANIAMDQAVASDKPFYLYMAHYAVHAPIMEDARFAGNYKNRGIHPTECKYATMVEGMDKSLGDIMANLKKHGLQNDTIVLFMSDNGGLSAVIRGGQKHTHNKPLSSGKGSSHEGGVRVPMIVKWPGITKSNSTDESLVMIEDFFPTILQMAGARDIRQIGGEIDGISFIPQLKGNAPAVKGRSLYFHFPNNWGPTGPGIGSHSAIRNGDWKLIYYHADMSYELFNLKDDIGETKNLYKNNKEIVNRLAGDLRGYLIKVDAQMPTVKATGKLVPFPEV